jgi:hypothetical protein
MSDAITRRRRAWGGDEGGRGDGREEEVKEYAMSDAEMKTKRGREDGLQIRLKTDFKSSLSNRKRRPAKCPEWTKFGLTFRNV